MDPSFYPRDPPMAQANVVEDDDIIGPAATAEAIAEYDLSELSAKQIKKLSNYGAILDRLSPDQIAEVLAENEFSPDGKVGELKLGVPETTDLSNYYNKTETYSKAELDPRIAKAKGSVHSGPDATGGGNGPLNLINHYQVSNVARSSYNGINSGTVWSGLSTQFAVYEHTVTFDPGLFEDDETYVVLLTPHGTGGTTYGVNRVMSLEIKEKHYTHFITSCMVYEHNSTATGNNPWAFDFVVF